MCVDDAGLDGDSLIGNVDGEDAVHSGEADHDATGEWKCAAGESGAGASGDKGNAMVGTDADDGLNFFARARQDNRGRQSTKSG